MAWRAKRVGDTGWIDITESCPTRTVGHAFVRRTGNQVWLRLSGLNCADRSNPGWFDVGTIPVGYRPEQFFAVTGMWSLAQAPTAGARLLVQTNGLFRLFRHEFSNDPLYGLFTWPTSQRWPG